jgi:hypothetical protein
MTATTLLRTLCLVSVVTCSATLPAFAVDLVSPDQTYAETTPYPAAVETSVGNDCPCRSSDGDGYVAQRQGYWQPGGYEGRIGSPYYYSAQGVANGRVSSPYGVGYAAGGDPYSRHFGPGFYRHAEYGHNRFPYYSYRRPWYTPGHPVYTRDTNLPW